MLEMESYENGPAIEVASWSPEPEEKRAPCTQVHLFLGKPPHTVVVRFKSARVLDELVDALAAHREEVWGKRGAAPVVVHGTVCKSCGKAIVWAETENGKAMPVEASATGNLILRPPSDPRGPPVAVFIKKGGPEPRTLRYVSHFATCPQAGEWRKP